MTYTKPTITCSGVAVVAIQSMRKPHGFNPDSGKNDGTTGAYEADE